MDFQTILSLFFPAELLENFDVKDFSTQDDKRSGANVLKITFEEKKILPDHLNPLEYETKDFLEKTILDVPIRTRPVELVIRRRRWRHKTTGQTVQRDLAFIAKGGQFTNDLVTFLKGGD